VSHNLFRSIPFACLFACLLACASLSFPACARAGAAPEPASSAANNADALTPDQAQRALDTLQDDKKRAQIIDTLRAIAHASPQAASAAPQQQAAIPLAADSLGAQLLLTVSEQVSEVSHQVADMARTLTHFPAFYYWIVRTANDPSAYDQLLDIAWKLALVFGCAFAAEWLIQRLIQRPVALLEARLPQTAHEGSYAPAPTQAVIDPPASAAEATAEPEHHGSRCSGCRSCWGACCSSCSRCSSLSASP
jgi:moderate conductance mechanosensitive channel